MYPDVIPLESLLAFTLRALGVYVVILPFSSCASLYLTWRILRQGHSPLAASVLLLVVPVPLLIGIFGGLQGILLSFQCSGPPSACFHEIAEEIGTAMYPPLVGLLLTMPPYAIAVAGTFTKSVSTDSN